MKAIVKLLYLIVLPAIIFVCFSFRETNKSKIHFSLPYKEAGLTKRQAAAHLLSRFTYGARPEDIDAVVNMGLEKWFEQQLNADLPDNDVNQLLSDYDALKLSNADVVNTFPKAAQVLRMAVKDGVINKDSVNKSDKAEYKKMLANYMQQKGFRPEKELLRQFENQKIIRAAFSENQLKEVLTDFWFNHFNVSFTKNDCSQFIPAYERDVIRPNVLGKFRDLLLATAKSPAMLMYLDNFSSSGTNTNLNNEGNENVRKAFVNQLTKNVQDSSSGKMMHKLAQVKKSQGLNENYAREVMELHTLGVDGGYTQQDVTAAARVLTGCTVYPISDYAAGSAVRKVVERIGEENLEQRGFVHDGDFLFAANRHDNTEKKVLGKTFDAGGGYKEGVELLEMLASNPSTAKFISKKLAVRFVSDNPPVSLINKMSKTFIDKDGDIKQVLITMVSSPEFWSKDVIRAKTKSPFELVISAVRSLNAQVKMPNQLYSWTDKIGQKMYYYQAPTGFPDKGQYWINTGALLSRMNFGLALASQRIAGIKIDLLALNNGHEPESAEAALATYSKIMLPERDVDQTIKRLTPLLHDPSLDKKVNQAADRSAIAEQRIQPSDAEAVAAEVNEISMKTNHTKTKTGTDETNVLQIKKATVDNNTMEQVVGIIIGSPEFQRR